MQQDSKQQSSTTQVITSLPHEEKAPLDINQLVNQMRAKFPDKTEAKVKEIINRIAKSLTLDHMQLMFKHITEWTQLLYLITTLRLLSEHNKLDELRPLLLQFAPISQHADSLFHACNQLSEVNKLNTETLALLLSEEKCWPKIFEVALAFADIQRKFEQEKNKPDTSKTLKLLIEFPEKSSDIRFLIYITFGKYPLSEDEYFNRLQQHCKDKKSNFEFAEQLKEKQSGVSFISMPSCTIS